MLGRSTASLGGQPQLPDSTLNPGPGQTPAWWQINRAANGQPALGLPDASINPGLGQTPNYGAINAAANATQAPAGQIGSDFGDRPGGIPGAITGLKPVVPGTAPQTAVKPKAPPASAQTDKKNPTTGDAPNLLEGQTQDIANPDGDGLGLAEDKEHLGEYEQDGNKFFTNMRQAAKTGRPNVTPLPDNRRMGFSSKGGKVASGESIGTRKLFDGSSLSSNYERDNGGGTDAGIDVA
jgi:hypothetical protein